MVRPRAAPVVDEVHVAVQRAPVQQAVRPVEPGIVQHIQRGHRGQHIQRLRGHALMKFFGWCGSSTLCGKASAGGPAGLRLRG